MSLNRPKPPRARLTVETLEARLVPAYLGPLLRPGNPVYVEDEAFGKAENNTTATATLIDYADAPITTAIEDKSYWRTVKGSINSGVKAGDTVTPDVDYYFVGDATGGPAGKFGFFVDLDSRASGESKTLAPIVSVVTEAGQVLARSGHATDLFTGEAGDDPSLYCDVPANTRVYVKVEGNGTTGNYTLRTLVDQTYDPNDTPVVLNSNPTPGIFQMYLDFNGYRMTQEGMTPVHHYLRDKPTWKEFSARPIDFHGGGFAGDDATFSPGERLFIYRTWQAVAEDYAAFNINVTTVEPAEFGVNTKKGQRNIILNGDYGFLAVDKAGNPVIDPKAPANKLVTEGGKVVGPAQVQGGIGGWAPVADPINLGPEASFGYTSIDGNSSNNPSARLSRDAIEVANVVSHEGSHNHGLHHQWHWDATAKSADGKRLRAPMIMNYFPTSDRLLWGGGWVNLERKQPRTLLQDDLFGFQGLPTLPNGSPFGEGNFFGFRPDDFKNDRADAAVLPRTGGVLFQRGLIEKPDDLDFFKFEAAGDTTITVNGLLFKNMSNLDVILNVYDAAGTLVTTVDPKDSYNASFTIPNANGTYYVSVQSTNKTITGNESDGNGKSTPEELLTKLPQYNPDGSIKRDAQGNVLFTDTTLVHYTYAQGQYTVSVQTASAANEPPALANGPAGTQTFTENDPPLKAFANVNLTDPDSPNWNGGKFVVTLTAGGTPDDRLTIRGDTLFAVVDGALLFNGEKVGTVTGGVGVAPLTVQFTSNSVDLAVAQEVLRRLAFSTASGDPVGGNRTLSLVATDPQGGASTAMTTTANLVPVNDPPTLVLGPRPNIAAGSTLDLVPEVMKATDPDTPAAQVVFTVVSMPLQGSVQLNGVALAKGGTFTQADVDAGKLKYVHAGEGGIVDSFVVTITDGNTTLAEKPVSIRVKSVFEPILVKNGPITLKAGERVIITNEILRFDVPAGSTTDVPVNGYRIAYYDFKQAGAGVIGFFENGKDEGTSTNWWQKNIDAYTAPGSNKLEYMYFQAPNAIDLKNYINGNKGVASMTFSFKVKNEYKNAETEVITFTVNFDTTGLVPPPKVAGFPAKVREDDTDPGGRAVRDIVAAALNEQVTDPFNEPAIDRGIAITEVDDSHGKWEYTTDGGETWHEVIDISSSRALLLRDDGEETDLRFVPDPDFDGEANYTFMLWDQSFWEAANPGQAWDESVWQSGTGVNLEAPEFEPAFLLGAFQGATDVEPVNDPPEFSAGPDQEIEENAGRQVVPNWTGALTDDSGTGLSYEVVHDIREDHHHFETDIEHDHALEFVELPRVTADGTLTYEVAPNSSGSMTFLLYATDGEATSEPLTFKITVHGVNAAPTITLGGDFHTTDAAGKVTQTGYASGISPGDDEGEHEQALTLTVTNNNPSLFAEQPSIDIATGTLSYKPAVGAKGTATVTVTLSDDGGGEEAGATTVRTFTITVKPSWSVTSSSPPIVVNVATNRSTRMVHQLLVTFSEDMNAASVMNPRNYVARLAGLDGLFGTLDDQVLRLHSVNYDAPAHTARVNLAVPVAPNAFVRLAVLDGIHDISGQRLDGDGNGVARGNFASILARGSTLVYTDRNGDTVVLGLGGAGQMELWRRGDGEGVELRLLGTFADGSLLTGGVIKPSVGGDQRTSLRRVVGMAQVIYRLPANIAVTDFQPSALRHLQHAPAAHPLLSGTVRLPKEVPTALKITGRRRW